MCDCIGLSYNLMLIAIVNDAFDAAIKVISVWIILMVDSLIAYAYNSLIYPLRVF